MKSNRAGRGSLLTTTIGLAAALLLAGAAPVARASAPAPYLVKNIRSGSADSNPFEITPLGPFVVFTAGGGGVGRELWRSDGTKAGTYRVLDIRPGSKTSNPRGLVRVGDLVYFSANDGAHGQELWVTDGTTVGTHMVKDIVPGKGLSMWKGSIWPIAVDVQGTAYFTTAMDTRLWRTDGTDAGTYAVPGSPTGVENLTAFGSRVYFGAGGKLWRSNGTLSGTKPVKNSNGQVVKQPAEIAATDSYVFFQFNQSKLWRSDGTTAGTFKILDLGPGCTYNCTPMMLTRAGNLVYFTMGEVWRSDGSIGGTFQVSTIPSWSSDMFVPVGERMFWTVDGRVWSSDGSVAGTQESGLPADLMVIYIFDVAGDPYYGAFKNGDTMTRLFSTDGTAEGTLEASPASPGWPLFLSVAGNRVIFQGRDHRGRELWAFDLPTP